MDQREPDPTPRLTPEYAAKRRRSQFWAMIMCIFFGVFLVLLALYARNHGGMVSGGPKYGGSYPWWLVAPAGVGLSALGVWGLWGHFTKRE